MRSIELDDTATVLVEFEGGIVGLIEAGWYHLYADGLEGYTQVYGTQGYARALPVGTAQLRGRRVERDAAPRCRRGQQQCDLPMYQAQMDHFVECILEDREPCLAKKVWAMRVLEAAYRSAKLGRP